MRLSEEGTMFTIGILFTLTFFILLISSLCWNDNQIRLMYQQVYQKSMECRIAYKDREQPYIDNVCGVVPDIKNFVK